VLTLLFAEQASSSGSGEVTFGVAAVSGTGSIRIAGSGTEAISVDATSAAGVEREIGTGSESFAGPALSGSGAERFAGTAAESISVASLDASGAQRISGSGSESFGVAGLDSSGSVNENNSGSITVPVSAFSGVGTERIVGSGGYVAAVPQFQGGQTEAPAPQVPQSGGGSVDGFVRWGPRPTVVKPIVPPIKPAAKTAVAGRGGIAVPVARTEGQGTLRLVLAAGDQTFGAPDIRGEGQHVRPVISGSLVMHAAVATYSGAGFQDLGPVEEEEMALLFAAAA
jgi:hypothetical protein